METTSLVIGAAGALLFVVVFVVDGATRPGYIPARHPVSALALGDRGWVQTTNFLVVGTAVAVSAVGVRLATGRIVLPIAVAVIGVALVASGVFPMDPMRGYPPGTPDGDPATFTTRHQRHDQAGAVVFGGLPVTAVVAAISSDDLAWTIGSVVVAVVVGAAAVRFSTAWEQDDPRTGWWQRVTLVVAFVWLGAFLLHLAGFV